jgi:hypothetical protein
VQREARIGIMWIMIHIIDGRHYDLEDSYVIDSSPCLWRDCDSINTVIFDFCSLELWENKFLTL